MLKTLGVIMVIAATSAMGLSKSLALRSNARFMTDFATALEVMRAEICTLLTPLPELITSMAETSPSGCRSFFIGLSHRMGKLGEESFAQLWTEQTERQSEPELKDEQRAAIRSLGMSLGRYDALEQQAAIDAAIARVCRLAEEARGYAAVQGKLWTGLGVSAGTLIAIVMI